MRGYGLIASRFWLNADLKAANAATPHSRELAAYLCTSPHTNGIGCYALPIGYAVADLWNGSGNGFETVSKGLLELSRVGFLAYCERTEHVFIRRFLRWNPLKNENVAKARQAEFRSLPREFSYLPVLAQDLLDHGKHWEAAFKADLEQLANSSETVGEPLPEPFRNPDPLPVPIPKQPGSGLPGREPPRARARGNGQALSSEERAEAERIQAELEQRRQTDGGVAAGPRHVSAVVTPLRGETRQPGNPDEEEKQ